VQECVECRGASVRAGDVGVLGRHVVVHGCIDACAKTLSSSHVLTPACVHAAFLHIGKSVSCCAAGHAQAWAYLDSEVAGQTQFATVAPVYAAPSIPERYPTPAECAPNTPGQKLDFTDQVM
jgi:hypothetical protein